MWIEWHHVWSQKGIYSFSEDIQAPTVSLFASVCELLIKRCPRGLVAQLRQTTMWIAGGEQCASGWKDREVYVTGISASSWYSSVSLSLSRSGLWEWVTKSAGQLSCPLFFLLPFIFVSPRQWDLVWYRYAACLSLLLIFCLFCLHCQACTSRACSPSHECLCMFLSSDCDLQSGRIVIAAVPHSLWYLSPATFHFTRLTSSGSDR